MDKEEKNLVLPFEFKAVSAPDEKGYVSFEGYAAAFDNVDLGKDVITKGAFAETIKEGVTWPILLDHMAYMTETAGYNLSATEDAYGLKIKGQINTNVEAGKIVYHLSKQALELGKTIGLSIGYATKERDYDEETGVRTLKKIKMYEYSFTNFPMNPKATITAMKSRQLDAIKNAVIDILEEKGLIETKDSNNSSEGDKSGDAASEQELKELSELINNLTNEVKKHE
jgi:HK97 family phage prohead protease